MTAPATVAPLGPSLPSTLVKPEGVGEALDVVVVKEESEVGRLPVGKVADTPGKVGNDSGEVVIRDEAGGRVVAVVVTGGFVVVVVTGGSVVVVDPPDEEDIVGECWALVVVAVFELIQAAVVVGLELQSNVGHVSSKGSGIVGLDSAKGSEEANPTQLLLAAK
ncbi:hypothetical protein HK104_008574 [Borealophlyctis nickersoniae]|nr:hypothetical protein HK104_008574 [Borealophlyctis nickersoniae]